ncbi:MAG: hypothetical protein HDT14_09065 [Oscillibacter sp.]|nr:hypothetical protein [Oscillibacter sp.]
MNITGIGKSGSLYPLSVPKAESEKAEAAQTARPAQTDAVSVSRPDGAAYYETLRKNFQCVKNGGVSISGAYLDQCANDPDKAKMLEESLAAYDDCVQRGYQNAKMSAQAAGGKLLSYSETWNIDSEGNLTMISCGTVEYDTGTKSWEDTLKTPLERLLESIEKAGREKEDPSPSAGAEDGSGEVSESRGGKVAVNEGKRARQIAAAATREQVQQVLALLRKDLADCKAGLEQGMCDEAEIAKVEALLSKAKARLSQVPNEADLDDPQAGPSAFELASLM